PLFFKLHGPPRALHSFPTRRSSDLVRIRMPRGELRAGRRAAGCALRGEAADETDGETLTRQFCQCGSISRNSRVPSNEIRHVGQDRKSTRLNSSHDQISYAVFCLKK